jgi:WD40 repeat protein
VWDVKTGTEKLVLRGHTGTVRSAIFSPNGELILTAGEDVTDDLKTTDRTIPLPPEIVKRVGTKDSSARLWNARTGQMMTELKGHRGSINSAVFSSDGKWILTASADQTAIIWDLSGDPVTQLKGHRSPIMTAVFGPGDEKVLTASSDRTAQIWPWKSYKRGAFTAHGEVVTSVGFRPDGSIVTAGRDSAVRLWNLLGKSKPGGADLNISQVKKTAGGSSNTPETTLVYGLAMSPKANFIVTGSRLGAKQESSAHVWDVAAQQFTRELPGHKEPVTKVVFSSTGSYVVTISEDMAQVWDTSNWSSIKTVKRHVPESIIFDAEFYANETALVVAEKDGTLQIQKITSNEQASLVKLPIRGNVVTMAFSPGGAKVATVTKRDRRVWTELWTIGGDRITTLRKPTGNVYGLAFSPASDLLATSSLDGFVRVWEVDSGEPVTEFQFSDFVSTLAFRPDNTVIVAGTESGLVYVFDCEACHDFSEIEKIAAENPPRKLTEEESEFYLPEEKDFVSQPPPTTKRRTRPRSRKDAGVRRKSARINVPAREAKLSVGG